MTNEKLKYFKKVSDKENEIVYYTSIHKNYGYPKTAEEKETVKKIIKESQKIARKKVRRFSNKNTHTHISSADSEYREVYIVLFDADKQTYCSLCGINGNVAEDWLEVGIE